MPSLSRSTAVLAHSALATFPRYVNNLFWFGPLLLESQRATKGFRETASASGGNLGFYDGISGTAQKTQVGAGASIKPKSLTDVPGVFLDLVQLLEGGDPAEHSSVSREV